MEKKILKFPKGFLWGAATSAHQVEGENENDWSKWEKENAERLAKEAEAKWQARKTGQPSSKFPGMFDQKNYISGRACDHYNRYEKDFDIAKSLNLNAFRISIEWSRIEPEEGKFNEKEIEHYRKVIEAIRARSMEPFVTLWHFTSPLWIDKKGGWKNKETIDYFIRYAEKVSSEFKEKIKFWITFNEPTTYAGHSYLFGAWPPQEKSLLACNQVIKNINTAHRKVHRLIHDKSSAESHVGIVYNLKHHSPYNPNSILDKLLAKIDEYFRDTKYLNQVIKHTDFIGLNYYFHDRLQFSSGGRFFGIANVKNPEDRVSDMGSNIDPEGIYCVLLRLKKYNLPIYITENGLADAKDEKRAKFIRDHLFWIHKAIQEGVDVCGYLYWSLLDNFEWDKGFWPRFGLVEMDYKTMERKIRPSAYEYAKICKENKITP